MTPCTALFPDTLISLFAFALVLFVPSPPAISSADMPAIDPDAWFAEDTAEPVPQVGEDELMFLLETPASKVLHSQNRITVSPGSLTSGWVSIAQCYRGLDAVARTEIVYRYENMRDLRIDSSSNIRAAAVTRNNVQLRDVGKNASLCIRTEAQILHPHSDGQWVLRNGPFHRKFLDGYFPLHVTLEVTFPAETVEVAGTVPQQQPGFEVVTEPGWLRIDSLFAGSLTVEINLTSLPSR